MKILLLANANSVHSIKWITSLANKGIKITVISLNRCKVSDYRKLNNVKILSLNQSLKRKQGAVSKLLVLRALPFVRKTIKEFKPDILHSHYATTYGLLGALSGFHPFIISVWGSDVFDFPKISLLHKMMLKFNFKRADKILSTSNVMAKETNLYTNKEIAVTPFGINMVEFKPEKVDSLFKEDDIVIGTIKTLESKYGIAYLIKAFKIVCDRNKGLQLRLLIVGGGSLDKELKRMVEELNISDKTIFTGSVPFKEVPKYHNMLSISVSVSVLDSESFGVAIIEASSCAKPVVVSNVGGLPEVVEDGVTGIVVPKQDIQKTAEAIEKLVLDVKLRERMGEAGRERVKKLYNWKNNVREMIAIYEKILKSN